MSDSISTPDPSGSEYRRPRAGPSPVPDLPARSSNSRSPSTPPISNRTESPPEPMYDDDAQDEAEAPATPMLKRSSRSRRLAKKDASTPPLTAEQRLLLLDTWRRSGLPAGDFSALVGIEGML